MKDYHLGYGMTIKVPMIHNMAMHYLFRVEDLSSTVLMLTLLTGNFATYFIIPDPGKMQKVGGCISHGGIWKDNNSDGRTKPVQRP